MTEFAGNLKMMPNEIIVNKDLRLRFLVPEDAERMYHIFQADPEIQSRVTWTHGLKTVEDIRTTIEGFQANKSIRYAILQGDELAGYIGMWSDYGYMDGQDHDGWYGLGYFLDSHYRGNGLVQLATRAMMMKAEDVFDVRRWSVYVEDDNKPSRAVLEKLGFVATDNTYDEPVLQVVERQWEKAVDESA